MTPLDELASLSEPVRKSLTEPFLPLDGPDDSMARQAQAAVAQERQNKVKASQLAKIGQVPYTDPATGQLQVVSDQSGVPISQFDQSNNIGWNSQGKPVEVQMDPYGNPTQKDPFADLPTQTDQKTGDIYKVRKGLPWQWEGKDDQIAQENELAKQQKALSQASTAIGRKLTLDEHAERQAVLEHKNLSESLSVQVPEVIGEGSLEDKQKLIDQRFAAEKQEANKTTGWFGFGSQTPDSVTAQQEIENRRVKAQEQLKKLYDLGDKIASHRDNIAQTQGLATNIAQQRVQGEIQRLRDQGIDVPMDSALVQEQAKSQVGPSTLDLPEDESLIPIPKSQAQQAQERAQNAQKLQDAGIQPSSASNPAHPDSEGKMYAVNQDGTLSFKGEGKAVESVNQAAQDGKITPDQQKQMIGQAAMADAKYANLVRDAGDNPQLLALLKGTAVGVGAGAVMLAAGTMAAEASAPTALATYGIGPFVIGGIAALTAGWVYNAAQKKILSKLEDYSDTVKQLNAASALHPNIEAGAEFAGNVVGMGGIKSIANIAGAAAMGARTGELPSALSVLAKTIGISAATGAGFELTLRPAYDATAYAVADSLGIKHDQFQSPTVQSVLTNATLAGLLAGKSIKFRDLPWGETTSIYARGAVMEEFGFKVTDNVTPEQSAAKFAERGINADPTKPIKPLTAEEAKVYESLKKQINEVKAKGGEDFRFAEETDLNRARSAEIGGQTIATEGGIIPVEGKNRPISGGLGEGGPRGPEPVDITPEPPAPGGPEAPSGPAAPGPVIPEAPAPVKPISHEQIKGPTQLATSLAEPVAKAASELGLTGGATGSLRNDLRVTPETGLLFFSPETETHNAFEFLAPENITPGNLKNLHGMMQGNPEFRKNLIPEVPPAETPPVIPAEGSKPSVPETPSEPAPIIPENDLPTVGNKDTIPRKPFYEDRPHREVGREVQDGRHVVVFEDSSGGKYSLPDRNFVPEGAERADELPKDVQVVLHGNYSFPFSDISKATPSAEQAKAYGPGEKFFKGWDETGREMQFKASDIKGFVDLTGKEISDPLAPPQNKGSAGTPPESISPVEKGEFPQEGYTAEDPKPQTSTPEPPKQKGPQLAEVDPEQQAKLGKLLEEKKGIPLEKAIEITKSAPIPETPEGKTPTSEKSPVSDAVKNGTPLADVIPVYFRRELGDEGLNRLRSGTPTPEDHEKMKRAYDQFQTDVDAETGPGSGTVDDGAHQAAASPNNELNPPTTKQAEAGNYKHGPVEMTNGLPTVMVETPAGAKRKPEWPELQDHYGYIKQTQGADGDKLDVFIKPQTPLDWKGTVYVVNQNDPKTGKFDEHKVVMGAADEAEARQIYARNYEPGWQGLHSIAAMPFDQFKEWATSGELTKHARNTEVAPLSVDERNRATAERFDKSLSDEAKAEREESRKLPIAQQPPRYWMEDEAASKLGIGPDELTGEIRAGLQKQWENARKVAIQRKQPIYASITDEPPKGYVKEGNQFVHKDSQAEVKTPPLERAMEIEKEFGLDAADAHFFNVAIDAVKASPEKWTTLAEGIQKEAMRAAVAAKGSLAKTGDLALSKRIAEKYLSSQEFKPENGGRVELSGGGKFHNDISGMVYQVHNDGKVLDVIADGTDYPVRITVEDYPNKKFTPAEQKENQNEIDKTGTPEGSKGTGTGEEVPGENQVSVPSDGSEPTAPATPEPHSEKSVADHIGSERKRLADAFKNIGAEVEDGQVAGNGLLAVPGENKIIKDDAALAKAANAVPEGKGKEWLISAFAKGEELVHLADAKACEVAGGEDSWNQIHKRIWGHLKPEQRSALELVIKGNPALDIEDHGQRTVNLAAEYIARLFMHRHGSAIPESFFRDVLPLVGAMETDHDQVIDDHLMAMEYALEGIEPEKEEPKKEEVALTPKSETDDAVISFFDDLLGEETPTPEPPAETPEPPAETPAPKPEKQPKPKKEPKPPGESKTPEKTPAKKKTSIQLTPEEQKIIDDAREGLFSTPVNFVDDMVQQVKEVLEPAIKELADPNIRTIEDLAIKKSELYKELTDKWRKAHPVTSWLFSTPVEQKSLDSMDRVAKVVAAAEIFQKKGVNTPKKLVEAMKDFYGTGSLPFAQAFWDALAMFDNSLEGSHDWAKLFAGTKDEQEYIEDFGEVLHGARKSDYSRRGLTKEGFEKLTDNEKGLLATRENIFPAPDYDQLIADGMEPVTAYIIRKIRSEISAKPNYDRYEKDPGAKKDELKKYVEAIADLRDQYLKAKTPKDIEDIFYEFAYTEFINQYGKTERKYKPTAGDILTLISRVHGQYRTHLQTAMNPSERKLKQYQKEIEETGWPKSKDMWEKRFKIFEYEIGNRVHGILSEAPEGTSPAHITLEERRFRANGQVKSTWGQTSPLFKDIGSAIQWAKDQSAKGSEKPEGEGRLTRPAVDDSKRNGKDFRHGVNVTDEMFEKAFGFRGGQFGNWTNQADRQQGMNQAYDALMDLADILNIPSRGISLNGQLGLAWGARGKGKAAAHYEPSMIVINLTKMKGAGSVAHEWAHAVDHYFRRSAGIFDPSGTPYASHGFQSNDTKNREEIKEAFAALMRAITVGAVSPERIAKEYQDHVAKGQKSQHGWLDGIIAKSKGTLYEDDIQTLSDMLLGDKPWILNNQIVEKPDPIVKEMISIARVANLRMPQPSALIQNANYIHNYQRRVDQALAGEIQRQGATDFLSHALKQGKGKENYWSRLHELFARAFENYVARKLEADNGRRNDYLVSHAKNTGAKDEGVWNKLYPGGEEAVKIGEAFDGLWSIVKSETNAKGDVRLYSTPTTLVTVEQKSISPDKLKGILDIAGKMVKDGVNDPRRMVDYMENLLGEKARPYYQQLWRAIGMVDNTLRGNHDWNKIINQHLAEKTNPPEDKTPKGEDEAPAQHKNQWLVALRVRDILSSGNDLPRTTLTSIGKQNGITDVKLVDEMAEAGIGMAARQIIETNKGKPKGEIFDKLLDLYNRQPNLTAKTSSSKINQGYSTPVPISYLAGVLSDFSSGKNQLDSTAGNALLVIDSDPKTVRVNEIDPIRLESLRLQGFKNITSLRMPDEIPGGPFDREKLNPPFGTILEGGVKVEFPMFVNSQGDTVSTKDIGHAIALKSLEQLAPDGKAVVILGGKKGTDQERADSYNGKGQIPFWFRLYDNFNVTDHFTIDGDLYTKQGAGWPIDVIVINGKGKSKLPLPSVQSPTILTTWEEVKGKLQNERDDSKPKGNPSEESSEGNGEIPDTSSGGGSSGGGKGSVLSEPTGGTGTQPVGEKGKVGGSTGGVAKPKGDNGEGSGTLEGTGGSEKPGSPNGTGGDDAGKPDVAGEKEKSVDEALSGNLPKETEDGPESLENQFQTEYVPMSKSPMQKPALCPLNLKVPMREALERISRAVGGDIDQYVLEKMDWLRSKEELFRVLDGAQVDAVALELFNFDNGGAIIVGDQTGMGKGRVVAALLAVMQRNGIIPIFATNDPKLYSAMIGDFHDIKADFMVPFFTNTGTDFTDPLGRHQSTPKLRKDYDPIMEEATRTGQLPKGANVIFTSYSQVSSDVMEGFRNEPKKAKAARKRAGRPRPDGIRMRFLRRMIKDSFVALDEAHLAAGDGPDGHVRFMQLLWGTNSDDPHPNVDNAPRGVYYSSATWAKRADNMPLFARTNLGRAVPEIKNLHQLFAQGGVPMQQVVCSMLAEDGQYLRREMDFAGIEFQTVIRGDKAENFAKADEFTAPVRDIMNFSEGMMRIFGWWNEVLRARAGKVGGIQNPSDQIAGTPFAQGMHNAVNQYLLGIKAKAVAEEAISEIKAGRKPIIALMNTMEGPLDDIETMGFDPNFQGLLHRYLKNSTRYKLTRPDETEEVDFVDFDFLAGELDDPVKADFCMRMKRDFDQIFSEISDTDLKDISISPIDTIKDLIAKAGFKVGEITGREKGLKDGKVYKRSGRERSSKGALESLQRYNSAPGDKEFTLDNGETAYGLDALLINQSGSTGISAHSAPKFSDSRQRSMIIAQPQADISQMMQIFGRINRKGQLHLPVYLMLESPIPAEKRLWSILKRKMSSLKANTTSNTSGSEDSEGTLDIFNDYGDEVIHAILSGRPEWVTMLHHYFKGDPLPPLTDDDGVNTWNSGGDRAKSITGEMAIMPTKEQVEFAREMDDQYRAMIAYHDAMGDNMLVADHMDLRAKPVEGEKFEIYNSTGDSVFDGPAWVQTFETKPQREPIPLQDVRQIADANGPKVAALRTAWEEAADQHIEDRIEEIRKDLGQMTNWADIERQNRERLVAQKAIIEGGFRMMGTAQQILMDGVEVYGLVTDIEVNMARPITPSTQSVHLHIGHYKRQTFIPMSQIFQPDRINQTTDRELERFYSAQTGVNVPRNILLGNIPAGFNVAQNDQNVFGMKIISYTDFEGKVRQGVLMPLNYSPGNSMVNVDSARSLLDALRSGVTIATAAGLKIRLTPQNHIEVRVPASRQRGGKYWREKEFNDLFVGQQMTERTPDMVAVLPTHNVEAFYNYVTGNLGDRLTFTRPRNPNQGGGLASTPIASGKVSVGDTVKDRMTKKTGTVTSVGKSQAVVRLDEGGKSGFPIHSLEVIKGGIVLHSTPVDPIDFMAKNMPGYDGAKSLLLPSAKSPEHLRAAEDVGMFLGQMNRRQEASRESFKKDLLKFEKLGVQKESMTVDNNPGIKFMSDVSTGRAMSPDMQDIADRKAREDEKRLDLLEEAGVPLQSVRENYFAGIWTRESREAFNLAIELAIHRGILGSGTDLNSATSDQKAWVKGKVDEFLKDKKGSLKDSFSFLTRTPFKGKESFRKRKVFDQDIKTAFEFGLRPNSYNPIDIMMLKWAEIDRSIMANQVLKKWKAEGKLKVRRLSDKVPEGWEDIQDKYGPVYGPKEIKVTSRNSRLYDEDGRRIEPADIGLDDLPPEGTTLMVKVPGIMIVGHRMVPKPNADILNNYLSSSLYNNRYFGELYKGWMGLANALNQMQLGFGSAFHLGFTTIEAQVSGGANLFKDIYGVLRGNRTVAQALKTAGNFIIASGETGLTGDKILNAFRNPDGVIDSRIAQVVRAVELAGGGFRMERGLQTDQISKMTSDWFNDHALRAMGRSPIAFVEMLARPLMDYIVPRQKAGVFAHMAWRIIEQNPGKPLEELTPEFRAAWNRVDARIGQVRYDRLFARNAAKNFIQGVVRAPGWTGGTIAELGGAFKDTYDFFREWAGVIPPKGPGGRGPGGPEGPGENIPAPGFGKGKMPQDLPDRVAYTLSLLLFTFLVNGVITYLMTGKNPEGMDYWAFKTGRKDATGKDERYMLPSYAKDLLAYSEAPLTTLSHKAHPILSVFGDLLRNKDYYGVQISDPEANAIKRMYQDGKYFVKAFEPFWIRGVKKNMESEKGVAATALPFIGVMPAPSSITKTAAEKQIAEINQARMPSLPISEQEQERRVARSHLTQQVRQGKTGEIAKAVRERTIRPEDVKLIMKKARMTPLQASVNTMTVDQLQRVIKVANPAERRQLSPILNRKIQSSRITKSHAMFTGFN